MSTGIRIEDSPQPQQPQTHYHIRWSQSQMLDWERYGTRVKAEAGAKELVRPGETYVIEEYGAACERCRALGPQRS